MSDSNNISTGIKEGFKELPKVVQFAIFVIVLIFIFIQVRKYSGKIKTALDKLDTKAEIQAFEAQGERLSYPKTQYKDFADDLFYSMDSQWYNPFSYGTDEDAIEEVFEKLHNNLDFLELKNAFGTRDGYTMAQWIVSELGDSWQEEINDILQSKNIKYRI